MKKGFIPLIVFVLLGMHTLSALEIQGVVIPSTAQVDGRSLQLNGAGLRTFTLLLVPIRIYVATLYTPAPIHSADAMMASPGPVQFDFTFLRAVGQSDVTKAWTSQFSQSVSYTYPGFIRDRDAFIAMFGPLQAMGVEQVQFIGTNTVVFDQGTQKGVISGRDFQKSFLSLWFGSNPVATDLKAALLGSS